MKTSLKKNYILGLDRIYNSQDYILGEFSEGTKNFDFLYSKTTGKSIITRSHFIIKELGEIPMFFFHLTDNNEICVVLEMDILKLLWENIISKDNFSNNIFQSEIRNIISKSNINDNPIIIKLKLK